MHVERGTESFLDARLAAIQLERDEEVKEFSAVADDSSSLAALQDAGPLLCDAQSGFGSRTTYALQGAPGRILASGRLSSGDPVAVRIAGDAEKRSWSGVLGRITEHEIQVHMDETEQDESFKPEGSPKIAVLRVGSDVTYKRYLRVIEDLRVMKTDHPAWSLRKSLLENSMPTFTNEPLTSSAMQYTADLNQSQVDAVRHCMNAKVFSCVHGPPGTGKTSTMVAFMCSEVERGSRILACAPSNVAVDNIAERLIKMRPRTKMLRLGHPARLLPSVVEHSLDFKMARSEAAALTKDIRREIDEIESQCRQRTGRQNRRSLRTEQRELRKELRRREAEALRTMVMAHDVILSTTTGAGVRQLDVTREAGIFDLVVVDEAAQSLEEGCWIAMLRARKCVIAGDPKQLPATVKSKEAAKLGLDVSLMDRVFQSEELYRKCVRMLDVQYRMHETISDWSSYAMYGGKVRSHQSVASHLLADLPGVEENEETTKPMVLIDTTGCPDCDEDPAVEGPAIAESKMNGFEARVLCAHMFRLARSGVHPGMISIITPYAAQVNLLRGLLADSVAKGLEIATVDAYQGRESEAVLISLVRSNEEGSLGFVTDSRRINVAVTRAKRHVGIVCNAEFVSRDKFLAGLIDHCQEKGEVRSAVEYDNDVAEWPADAAPVDTATADEAPAKTTGTGRETVGDKKSARGKRTSGRKRSMPGATTVTMALALSAQHGRFRTETNAALCRIAVDLRGAAFDSSWSGRAPQLDQLIALLGE